MELSFSQVALAKDTDLSDGSKLSLLQCFNLQLVAGVRLPEDLLKSSLEIEDCKVCIISPEAEVPAIEYLGLGFVRDINFKSGFSIVSAESDWS